MALQPYTDGSYNILYDEKRIVELRDWAAVLANTLSDKAVAYLDSEKEKTAQKKREKIEKAKRKEIDPTVKLEKEVQRLGGKKLEMMGDADIAPPTIANSLPKKKKVTKPLVPQIKPRTVQTDRGPMTIAGDVSDDEVRAMGFNIIESAATPDTSTDVAEPSEPETEHSNGADLDPTHNEQPASVDE